MPDFHMIAGGPRVVAPFSQAADNHGCVILTEQTPTDPGAPDAPLPEGVETMTRRGVEKPGTTLNVIGSTQMTTTSKLRGSRL